MSAPSRAARELAEDVEKYFGLQNCTKPVRHMIAKRIDQFMADLLFIARHTLAMHENGSCIGEQSISKLKSALEPWKE